MASAGLVVLGTFAALASVLYGPVSQRLVTLGVTRPMAKIVNDHGHDFRLIEGTVQCEDLHHHLDSGLLFAACQGKAPLDRLSWFPPLAVFDDHKAARNGELVIVDPQTFKATSLKLAGFEGPLITHGIDVITNPEDAGLVHIFAINHLPNPLHYRSATERDTKQAEVRSQIELFTHRIGSDTATWRRSVRDPLIRTPNDILATSPTSFYVTNDHHFRSGFGRFVEDVMFEKLASWTDTIYVQVGEPDLQTDADRGKFVVKVLHAMHNNNGLGRSAIPGEVLIGDATDGVMYRAAVNANNPGLKLVDWVQVDTTIDNPTWFHDPFANATHDSSGYVLAGMLRAVDLGGWTNPRVPVPSCVWHVRAGNRGRIETGGTHNDWDKRLIFADDGKTARTLSTAVLVAIDPAGNGGRKQAWLFATGFASDAMVATRVDL